ANSGATRSRLSRRLPARGRQGGQTISNRRKRRRADRASLRRRMAAGESEKSRHPRGIIDCRRGAAGQRRKILQGLRFRLTMYRTHNCNSLRKTDIGKEATLAGWVHVSRDHGGVIFVDLRDREGITQVVFRPEENAPLAKAAHGLRSEEVIQVSREVAARVPGPENSKPATGEVAV